MNNVQVQPIKIDLPLHPRSAKLISLIEEDIACQRLLIEAIRQIDCIQLVHEFNIRIVKHEGVYLIGIFGPAEAITAVSGMLSLLPQYVKVDAKGGKLGTGDVCIGIAYHPPI